MLLLLLVISQDGQCEMDVTEAETVKWTQSEAKVVGVCRLPKTKTPWYLPYLHAFSPTRVTLKLYQGLGRSWAPIVLRQKCHSFGLTIPQGCLL